MNTIKKKRFLLGIQSGTLLSALCAIALVAAIALSMAACDMIDELIGGDKDEGGTFTLNGIPSDYNGKYAYFMGINENNFEDQIVGLQSYSGSNSTGNQTITLSRISNRSVSTPMWKVISDDELEKGYSGNGTYRIAVIIVDSQTIRQQDGEPSPVAVWGSTSTVAFSKGSAAMSWSQGEEVDLTDENGDDDYGGGGIISEPGTEPPDINLAGTGWTTENMVLASSGGINYMGYYHLLFYSDGTFEISQVFTGDSPDSVGVNTQTGTYTVSGYTGTLYVDGTSVPFTVSGNTLRVTEDDGEVLVFTN